MDSRTHLDYALFQLTPTRTRCDLVVCAGGATEKLASGLLEPFVSHLKYAKDQISKGGYSITLRSDAAWFTKATLERFVRFVSTPEVLERFVTLEKEIEQIEKSIESNEVQNNDAALQSEGKTSVSEGNLKKSSQSSVLRDIPDGSDDGEAATEENSKVRLQRILQTRKVVLRKEQAMAFARALVAGFELDYIDNLICFADAFGALRMREACINFMSLCKEKDEDRHWKDEIAAMQAFSRPDFPYFGTSGIILASDDNGPSRMTGVLDSGSLSGNSNNSGDVVVADPSTDHRLQTPTAVSHDGRLQMPMPWQNHLPQYMENFQGPFLPQMHPYPSYMLPNMQIPPPYYPGNGTNWPPTAEDYSILSGRESDVPARKNSSKNKKKHSQRKASEEAQIDESTEVSDSYSGSESDRNEQSGQRQSNSEKLHRKNPGKKSSRKVVIRNINYITSERDGRRSDHSDESSSSEVDGESIKHQVEKAIGSVHRQRRKKRETKDRFSKDELKSASDEEDNMNRDASHSEGARRNENWDAFQNLLMESRESASFVSEEHHANLQVEHFSSQSLKGKLSKAAVIDDSLLISGKDGGPEYTSRSNEFQDGHSVHPLVKKRDSTYEDLLITRSAEESQVFHSASASDYSNSTSTIKMQKERDWLIGNQRTDAVYQQESMELRMVEANFGSSFGAERKRREILVDDSFMLEGRQITDDHSDSRLAMDIGIVPDIDIEDNYQPEQSKNKHFEPDDLYMVLDREADEHAVATWTPELDYANNRSVVEEIGQHVNDEATESSENNPPSNIVKDVKQAASDKKMNKGVKSKLLNGTPGKGKPDIMARNRKPVPGSRTNVPKSKAEMEDERRRRMEELLIQRQKRIAERSSNHELTPVVSKDSTVAKKQQKPVLRNSTIERLATARVTQKAQPAQPKPAQPVKTGINVREPTKIVPQKAAGAKNQKSNSKITEPSKKNTLKNSDGSALSSSRIQGKKGNAAMKVSVLVDFTAEQTAQPVEVTDEFKDIPEMPTNPIMISGENFALENETAVEQSYMPLPTVQEDSAERTCIKHENAVACGDLTSHDDHVDGDSPDEVTVHPVPSINDNMVASVHAEQEPSINDEVQPSRAPQAQMFTPPPSSEVTAEPTHPRKKWHSEDNYEKPAKGLMKLLLFGRKKTYYA